MILIKTNTNKSKIIDLLVHEIKSGKIVVYPTDTLYGIGVNALDKKMIGKVFKIKGRKINKPLLIAVDSLKTAGKYVKFNNTSLKLAKKFLPGPLTLILPLKKKLPKILTQGKNEVGIRIPDNKFTLEFIRKCGFPLTSTSANISGGLNPTTSAEAIKQIGDHVDLIIDAGRCKYKKPSTIVRIVNNEIEIVREGAISKKKLFS
jgi:L-threonylcarbamoyladenylate synthase